MRKSNKRKHSKEKQGIREGCLMASQTRLPAVSFTRLDCALEADFGWMRCHVSLHIVIGLRLAYKRKRDKCSSTHQKIWEMT